MFPTPPSTPPAAPVDALSALIAFLQSVGGGNFSITISGTLPAASAGPAKPREVIPSGV